MSSRTFLPKPGGKDRPDRKRAMRGVESVECPAGGLHVLRNFGGSHPATRCIYCHRTWAELDAEINGRAS